MTDTPKTVPVEPEAPVAAPTKPQTVAPNVETTPAAVPSVENK
jgi:hypothetical protein